MKRKGISPLIAAVLLIAFTISISTLVMPFFSSTMQSIQEGNNEEQEKILNAAEADLSIESAKYDSSSGNYTVTVKNSGSTELENFTVTATGERPYQKQVSETLEAKELYTLTLETDNSTKEEELQIEAENVPVKSSKDLENIVTGSAPAAPTGLSISS